MVDLLAWVVIGVIIVNALLKMSMMVSVYVTMSALLEGALGVLVAFVSKHLIQVVIDIADIALLERQKDHKSPSVKSDEPES